MATASGEGQPHVVPMVYEFDGTAFYFTGWNLEKSLKFKNLIENKKVALVIDDLVTVCPWRPRGLEVRGVAELGSEGAGPTSRCAPWSSAAGASASSLARRGLLLSDAVDAAEPIDEASLQSTGTSFLPGKNSESVSRAAPSLFASPKTGTSTAELPT